MGKTADPTPEERKAVVEAYARLGNAKKAMVESGVRWKIDVVNRIINEAGFTRRKFKRPPDDELRALWAEPWQNGASITDLTAMIGVGVAPKDIKRIMEGIPRRTTAWKRPRVTSVTITDDEEVWKWFAGVFDIRGSIARPVNHPPFVYVSVGGERERAQTILDTIGIGFVVARASRHRTNYMWSCQAKLEVVAVLERTVPYMRTRQGVTRRIIADVKGETPVTRGPP